jgi:tRNA(His) guanylyltransferase
MSKDSLGDRMKSKYEDVFRHSIPQRTHAILRIDGKAFHTFTKGLPRPYSPDLSAALDYAAMQLCKVMQGCALAYGQSDEYSFLFTDFADIDTQMWFNGNVQKITSVAASLFTAHFNSAWQEIIGMDTPFQDPLHMSSMGKDPYPKKKFIDRLGMFDARVFVIPPRTDVMNYFVWRQQDASRNSLSMLASHYYSASELHGKKAADKHEMLHRKGQNWNNWPTSFKRGRVVHRLTNWVVDNEIPIFSDDHAYLEELVPEYMSEAAASA